MSKAVRPSAEIWKINSSKLQYKLQNTAFYHPPDISPKVNAQHKQNEQQTESQRNVKISIRFIAITPRDQDGLLLNVSSFSFEPRFMPVSRTGPFVIIGSDVINYISTLPCCRTSFERDSTIWLSFKSLY